jgi:mpaB/rubber oxygenase-like protein
MPDTKYTDQLLDSKRLIADSEADAVIAQLIAEKGKGEAKKLFDTLIREITLPVEKLPKVVRDFIESSSKLPHWIDKEKIQMAHDLFLDHGPKFLIFLYYKSLPILYSCANGAEVLVQTGRLVHQQNTQQFTRRIAETGQFLIDVMNTGSLLETKKGIEVSIKVRLIHAAIRSFIPAEKWDEQVLGKPINQEDLAITLMTFSIAILDGLDQFGIEEEEDKKEAYLHFWNVIGYFLGIDKDILPDNIIEARFLLQKIIDRQSAPSEQGQLLTRGLLEFAHLLMPSKLLKNSPEVLMQFMLGEKLSNMLKIEAPLGCLVSWLPDFLKKIFGLTERLEDRAEPLRFLLDEISKTLAFRMVEYFDTYKNRNFEIPNSLQSKWFGT